MTDAERRNVSPECADHSDPIDSWSLASLLVGAAMSLLGLGAMAVGIYGYLTR